MDLKDRLEYALIGAFLGALLGAGLWWAFACGHNPVRHASRGACGLQTLWLWVKATAALAAVLGFVLKVGIGDVLGLFFGATLQSALYENRPLFPGTVLALVLLGAFAALLWWQWV